MLSSYSGEQSHKTYNIPFICARGPGVIQSDVYFFFCDKKLFFSNLSFEKY